MKIEELEKWAKRAREGIRKKGGEKPLEDQTPNRLEGTPYQVQGSTRRKKNNMAAGDEGG